MPYMNPCQNEIVSLTNYGRSLSTRVVAEGLSFVFWGWNMGLGGYGSPDPTTVIAINPALTNLLYPIYPTANFTFTVTSANATAGAVYTDGFFNYTVQTTIAAKTALYVSGSGGPPSTSGTLVLSSGSGDANITYSAWVPDLITFVPTDFELASTRSIACQMRVPRETPAANYGIGEIGVWTQVLNSPLNPSENGTIGLFAVVHMPLTSIPFNRTMVFRNIITF